MKIHSLIAIALTASLLLGCGGGTKKVTERGKAMMRGKA